MAELHPKNDEAAEIVLGWASRCTFCGPCRSRGLETHQHEPTFIHYCELHGVKVNHDVESIDMRTPAMVVKMIEWLMNRTPIVVMGILGSGYAVQGKHRAPTLADALILAVISTKESTDGND